MTRLFFAATLALTLIAAPAFAQTKKGADCSPGYYKKHVDTWDSGRCCLGDARDSGTACGQIYLQLCAECGGTATTRAAAKEILDACFGTAAASPCTDDD